MLFRSLEAVNFAAVERLASAGRLLDDVLPLNSEIGDTIEAEAFCGASYSDRVAPVASLRRVERAATKLGDQLDSITISAPPGVTLSSDTGQFSATVTNGLDVTVRVRLAAESDRPMRLTLPDELTLPPNGSTMVLLDARTRASGVHNLVLAVTDLDGRRLGSSATVPVRSLAVSRVIWLIMGFGGVLLFGTIGLRAVRRLRGRRSGEAA